MRLSRVVRLQEPSTCCLSPRLAPTSAVACTRTFLYYLSEFNPSDGPTRGRDPPEPSWAHATWWQSLAAGEFAEFDAWMAKVGALRPGLSFDHLEKPNAAPQKASPVSGAAQDGALDGEVLAHSSQTPTG